MKAWRDLKEVALPRYMRDLPRDPRGYPVPWVALSANGKHDFRVLDQEKVAKAYTECRCSLCGRKMHPREYAFVGGPMSIHNRLFYDPAMHKECAQYAVQVCPFIAAPKFSYTSKVESITGVETHMLPGMSENRPTKFGLGLTTGFHMIRVQDDVAIHAAPFYEITWWQHGTPLTL